MILFDLVAPIVYYWVRLSIRSQDTGVRVPTNWVDFAAVSLWVLTTVIFLPLFGMYPFHFLTGDKSEALDWTIAWYLVNIIATMLPAISLIWWLWYLIIAIGSGRGSNTKCHSDGVTCIFNNTYVSYTDGWLSWALYTILAGGSYFTIFWFGGDTVRYLRPGGGYELKYLWPSTIYDLLVVVGVAPDSSRVLDGYSHSNSNNDTSNLHEDDQEDKEESPFVTVEGESLLVDF